MYSRVIKYGVERHGDFYYLRPGSTAPVFPAATRQDFLLGKGHMAFSIDRGYEWDGWIEQPSPRYMPAAFGPLRNMRIWSSSGIQYIQAEGAPNSSVRYIEGRCSSGMALLAGRVVFNDSSRYEGFFCGAQAFGPGTRFAANDTVGRSGIWMLDSMAIPLPVHLPPAVFAPGYTPCEIGPIMHGGTAGSFARAGFHIAPGKWLFANYADELFAGVGSATPVFDSVGVSFNAWYSRMAEGDSAVYQNRYWTGHVNAGDIQHGMQIIETVGVRDIAYDGLEVHTPRQYEIYRGLFENGAPLPQAGR